METRLLARLNAKYHQALCDHIDSTSVRVHLDGDHKQERVEKNTTQQPELRSFSADTASRQDRGGMGTPCHPDAEQIDDEEDDMR